MTNLILTTGLLVAGVLLLALGVTLIRERRPSSLRLAGPIYRGSGDVIAGAALLSAALHHLHQIIPE